MKKASVVIPVYNSEKFIYHTLSSALSQSYKNLEIVIVDDTSKDNTEKIIKENFSNELNSKKIIYIKNKENLERCESRNIGVKYSGGDYIFFLDHDDMYKEDYIKSVIPYFNEYDLIYSIPRSFIDEDNKIIRVSKMKYKEIGEEIFSGNIGYSIGIAIRKECFTGFNKDFLYREDWEFIIRNYMEGKKIKILDNDKIFIREHNKRTGNDFRYCVATLNILESYFEKIENKYRPFMLFHAGETCLRFGRFLEGWKMVILASMINSETLLKKRQLGNLLKWGLRLKRI